MDKPRIPASKAVNKVGKYLYKHIDGAYSYKVSVNTNDIYMVIYYQVPMMSMRPGQKSQLSDLQEMHININVTTYQNKIRINMIEMSPDEVTLGFDVYPPEMLYNLYEYRDKILDRIRMRLEKLYEGYEFIF